MVVFRFSYVVVVIILLERNIKTDRKSRSFVLEKCIFLYVILCIIKVVFIFFSEINCLCFDSFREVIIVLIVGEGF